MVQGGVVQGEECDISAHVIPTPNPSPREGDARTPTTKHQSPIKMKELIIQRFVVNMLQENCYVVSDASGECVIIDCGAFYDEEKQAIAAYISQNNLKPVHLLGTHGHLDHNFGNEFIDKEYGLKLELSERDNTFITEIDSQRKHFGNMIFDINMPPAGHFLEENELIRFGTHTLKVIETPGHSRGSVCFYEEEEGVLFSGDTLFQSSIGRTDLDGGSMMMIIQSLRMLCQLPDSTVVYPGHGLPTTMGDELAHNPYLDR